MERPDQVTVRVLKYDRTEYRRWNARISQHNGSLLVLDAEFEYDVQHDLLGVIQGGTRTIEYYWLDRWYNIFRFMMVTTTEPVCITATSTCPHHLKTRC